MAIGRHCGENITTSAIPALGNVNASGVLARAGRYAMKMHTCTDRACDTCDHHLCTTLSNCKVPCFIVVGFAKASGCITPLTRTAKRAEKAQVGGDRAGIAHMGNTHAS